MHCPFCGNDDTRVIDSRVAEDGAAVRRRRECEVCGKRFSSYERAELRLPMVIKKDGTRQSFDTQKIRGGMQKALEKRPVSADALEQGVQAVLRAAQESSESEIPAGVIGDFVMEQLRQLDGVAYIRFASVYREFKDVDEFVAAVKSAMRGKGETS
ncbi:MAG: transcriptional regulator NrdR [Zetaproteobacteria bacterium CG12_big_fil_rev_8_21_14_0_65_55_1124]|nr:MAG: transcriptional regulator NrdR [Zetaproteobacteria bacterium CG1_02_55_237]PIS20497.1 MAG: transcriptional regulator NrdR [Zetaproteobacteria bacterium CG08_land_8_20_14_0_20_55_17]PIW43775.1 MAG: transcriptional regulator NrdR [Zetaproteobacteria bacterium CG12_big_fil_rev_8_21_14_0_65_55_1124]PIY53310.1 MAG: transcriptional regulator NrdR [Zetaproteobacteria bacterium CG_4_10_14_0_8_um_filter_55_43]PIZ40117.1 MAG: transcriptional regulator NrdR [Zetaproteobacteria bacterium CG_4_10_14